jgi:hypothetical protein
MKVNVKLNANAVLSFCAAVLAIVTLIIVEVSFTTAQGWFDSDMVNGGIIALAIVAAILAAANGVISLLGLFEDNLVAKIIKNVALVGACLCLGFIVGLTLQAIATEFAYTFFSEFNIGTVKESFMPTACIQAVVGIVFAVVTLLVTGTTAAFERKK